MSWHHVAALLIAAAMVIACGVSERCSHDSQAAVIQLATVIVAGAFGHAGAGMRSARRGDHEQPRNRDLDGDSNPAVGKRDR
jgi:hypothetical protein